MSQNRWRVPATAWLDGLGLEHVQLSMARADTGVGIVYDSDVVAIPGGPATAGCLTVTVELFEDEFGEVEYDQNNYHTATASCPDFP